MNIIFMGTPDFAVPSLEALAAEDKINISAVVTQPDRKSGRGQKVRFSDVKKTALNNDLKVLQTDNVNKSSFLAEIKSMEPDFVVVVAFGQKLGEELLDTPKHGCINLHA